MLGFFAVGIAIIGLIHYYLWRRLVRNPLRPGWGRRIGTVVVALLAVLLPATLIGTRTGHLRWLAWPGYLWIGLMFYLLIALLVLEVPRLAVLLLWRRSGVQKRGADLSATAPAATSTSKPDHDEAGAQSATNAPTRADAATDHDEAGAQSATNAPTRAGADTNRDDAGARTAAGAPTSAENDSAAGRNDGVDRRLVLARGVAIFAGLTAASVTGYGVRTALGAPTLDRVRIPLAKLPRALDGTRLAVVSDIHLGPLTGTRHAGRIVELINSLSADIVCIVGDLVDGSVAELGRFAEPLRDIESRQGAYFVTGNHEYYSGFQEWVDEVARLGVRPLRNERIALGGLDLAGVNDLGGSQYGDAPDFGRALGDRDPARPVVLMAHQPAAAHEAAPYGVDLQVSGHTHGGQMAPFNLLVKLDQPVVSGLGTVDGTPVYVTNGAGFWGPPVRVGAPPQVTVIELRTP